MLISMTNSRKLVPQRLCSLVRLSLVLGMLLFFLLPVWLGNFFKTMVPVWALGVIEGLLRILIFLAYLFLISRMKEIKRVFQYHGAEHKTINCFESGAELTVEIRSGCHPALRSSAFAGRSQDS